MHNQGVARIVFLWRYFFHQLQLDPMPMFYREKHAIYVNQYIQLVLTTYSILFLCVKWKRKYKKREKILVAFFVARG